MANFEEDYPFDCPYCGVSNCVRVDYTAGQKQKFVVDCEICCRPILCVVEICTEGIESFSAERE